MSNNDLIQEKQNGLHGANMASVISSNYAVNYRNTHAEKYAGKILIIDYGWETLSIHLCDVDWRLGRPYVKVEKSNTVGVKTVNHSFVEMITNLSLQANGLSKSIVLSNPDSFELCAKEVELLLKSFIDLNPDDEAYMEFRDDFELFSLYDLVDDTRPFIHYEVNTGGYSAKETFMFIPQITEDNCKDAENVICYITYGMIARAFLKVMTPFLEKQFAAFADYLDTHGVDWHYNSNTLKIQFVGEYCKFLLAEKEISRIIEANFTLHNADDRRFIGQLPLLLDSDLADLMPVAGYAIGIEIFYSHENDSVIAWAVSAGTVIESNKVYLFKWDGYIVNLIGCDIQKLELQSEKGRVFSQRLTEDSLQLNENKEYILGLSMDVNGTVSLHWWELLDDEYFHGKAANIEDMINGGNHPPFMGKENTVELTGIMDIRVATAAVRR